ncbi:MAG: hypothetical protein ACRDXE_08245 [Acidimicrobiales bacterium]
MSTNQVRPLPSGWATANIPASLHVHLARGEWGVYEHRRPGRESGGYIDAGQVRVSSATGARVSLVAPHEPNQQLPISIFGDQYQPVATFHIDTQGAYAIEVAGRSGDRALVAPLLSAVAVAVTGVHVGPAALLTIALLLGGLVLALVGSQPRPRRQPAVAPHGHWGPPAPSDPGPEP